MTLIKTKVEKVILGIDPGTNVMGYGLINVSGNTISLITLGVFTFKHLDDHYLKLKEIFENVTGLIKRHLPDELAIESPFFGKNVQSMLKLGRAQGIAIAAALNHQIPVFEYEPKLVKQSVCGNGNASKEQVASMVHRLVNVKEPQKYLDSTDALAVAVCHHFKSSGVATQSKPVKRSTQSKKGSWSSFLSANPEKVLNK